MGEMMKTVNISGMGKAYELCCQLMLHDALDHFKDRSSWKDKEFSEIWKKYTPTPKMANAVRNHFIYIKQHGYEEWLKLYQNEPERIYEIDIEQGRQELKRHMAWVKANPEEASKQATQAKQAFEKELIAMVRGKKKWKRGKNFRYRRGDLGTEIVYDEKLKNQGVLR